MGSSAYTPAAKKLASMGYDVFLLNGNDMVGDKGVGLKAAIDKAQQSRMRYQARSVRSGSRWAAVKCSATRPRGPTKWPSW